MLLQINGMRPSSTRCRPDRQNARRIDGFSDPGFGSMKIFIELSYRYFGETILNLVVLKPSIEREILGRRLELWCGVEFLFFRKWFEKIPDFNLNNTVSNVETGGGSSSSPGISSLHLAEKMFIISGACQTPRILVFTFFSCWIPG